MKNAWLEKDHSREWLILNLCKINETNETKKIWDFSKEISYTVDDIKCHWLTDYTHKKLSTKEEFFLACISAFDKNQEIAFSPLLLNIDYLLDLDNFDKRNYNSSKGLEKFLIAHEKEREFLSKDKEIAAVANISKEFLSLQIYECNMLYEFFDTYYYGIDNDSWFFIVSNSFLNTKGKQIIRKKLLQLPKAMADNELYFEQLMKFRNMTIAKAKCIYKESKKTFESNLEREMQDSKPAKIKHLDKYFKRELTNQVLLEKLLHKFDNLSYIELDRFRERIFGFVTMDNLDWQLLMDFLLIPNKEEILKLIDKFCCTEKYLNEDAIKYYQENNLQYFKDK